MTYNQPWVADALCAQIDGDLWFPETTGPANEARRICARCPVRTPCLEWALHRPEHGIWGGTSEHQRKELRRQRGIRVAPADRIPHGTEAGARAHYRRKEKPCLECAFAQARRERERYHR